MTIEENLRKLIREKYLALTVRIREKAAHKRIYPDSIADYYEDYYQALEDALRVLVGADAVKGFKEYYKDLESALIAEAKTLQRAYDVKSAREHLNKLTKAWNGLDELLTVIHDGDLLWLNSYSDFAWSSLVDNFEIFEDALDKMLMKYGLYVPVPKPEKVSPDEPVKEKKRRGRKKKPE